MDRAYIFPRNVPVDKANIGQATPAFINTDYSILRQAANYERLRCVCVYCLEPLSPVRRGGEDVSHFSHRPLTDKSPLSPDDGLPLCPYRSVSGAHTDGPDGPRYRHNIRKIIESVLYHQLLRTLSARPGISISVSEALDREPRIQIDGLARPIVILSIAPHEEKLWKEPFDGTLEGRQVLFFIASIDIPQLVPAAKEINHKLVAQCPTIAVYPPSSYEGQDHTFVILSQLPSDQDVQASAAPLNQLDLIYADYKKLFGLERGSEYLFIRAPERGAIDYVEELLASAGDSPKKQMLQLLAKRMLVDSAGIQQIAFHQPLSEARQFFRACDTFPGTEQLIDFQGVQQLLTNTEVLLLFQKQPTLWPLYGEFFSQAIDTMRDSLKNLEEENHSLVQRLETQCKAISNLQAERDRLKQDLGQKEKTSANELAAMELNYKNEKDCGNQLKLQLEKVKRECEDEHKRRKELEKDLETLKTVPLSRYIFKHYEIDWS